MAEPGPNAAPGRDEADPGTLPAQLVLRLHTPDTALRDAWEAVDPPPGFRLEVLPTLTPDAFAGEGPSLVLVDAAVAADAEGALADAIDAHLHRCVWTGPAEAVERLGPARLRDAYDILVTPVTATILGRRLDDWSRNIRRTAALEHLGHRAEDLAEQNSRLAARLADAEQASGDLAEERRRLDRALHRIHTLARLSHRINSLDLDQIVEAAVHELPQVVEARRASLYFYDAADDRLVLQGHSHESPIAERVELAANPNSPMAHAVRRGELLLVGRFNTFQKETGLVVDRPYEKRYDSESCIVVPLKGSGRVCGILNLADKKDGLPFDPDIDLPIIEQMAELIGASIYNVELFREMEHRAKSDPLTGLANRRALEETLAREVDRTQRYGSSLAVLMIDVDGLKDVNDRHGHPAGDAVLQNLAAILLEAVRSVDVPGRWAGDEFLVILPDTGGNQSEQLARRLRRRSHEQPARLDTVEIPATISIGVTEYVQDDTAQTLVRRVDQALYRAKEAGRDRIATA
ncbi:MAG: sensor domain-containing diguanylate cyclase [Phycisphaerae bacterium]